MEAFQWNTCFVTGITMVDEQHHRLVDLINRFGALVMREESASSSELEEVFTELADYAQYHFAAEETLMAATGLDARYIVWHRQSHVSFMEDVVRMHGALVVDNGNAAKSLLQFLTHWLAYHILGTDQGMARQIASVHAGVRPEEAYLSNAPVGDAATEILLSALNGLFQQVSERNHALMQLNKTLEARVDERTHALTVANQQLDELANTDVLTGLPNRRYAMLSLARQWDAGVRNATPLACLMIDADGFKTINDTHGHDAGDTVLHALSKALRYAVRTDDTVCRLGGDEFLIICAGTPIEGAVLLAETIRAAVAALRVPAGAGEWRGSISVGVAARTAVMKGFDDLLQAADQGLYAAKRSGRNCVAIADANKNARGADFPLDTEGRVMPSHVRRPLELMPDAIQFASRPH